MITRSSLAAALGLAAVLTPAFSRGDEGDVPPPPLPASQMPGAAQDSSDRPQGWLPNNTTTPASKSMPAASPQSITVPVAAAPAPVAAAPQTVSFQVQLVPTQAAALAPVALPVQAVAAAPAPAGAVQVAQCHSPGPIGRAVGKMGQYLTRAGMTKLYVPNPEVQQVVYTTTQAVQVPLQGFAAVAPSAQSPVQASAQSPVLAVPRKGLLHR